MKPSTVTVRDVARAAGLSVASVSRALSGTRRVSPEVARRVAKAADSLNYKPHFVARALSLGSTSTVGLIVPDILNPFFPVLAEAIERTLKSEGLSMLLMNSENDANAERDCIAQLIDRRVDGLLISATHRIRSRPAIEQSAKVIPVVQVDRFATSNVDRVVTDPVKTVLLPIEHMAAQGRRNFAFVGAQSSASPAMARRVAFQRLVRNFDAEAPDRVLTSDFSLDWGYEAAKAIARRWPEVDAVVCANDLVALGLVQGSIDLGRHVPQDLAVTGCDDTFLNRVIRPTITSVAQPVWEIARHAVDLLGRPASSRKPLAIELAPELHARGSTTP